jgi:hypothetical protein
MRNAAWKSAVSKAEVTISGPATKEVSSGLHRIWLDVFVTLTSDRSDNDYDHIGYAGAIANALDQCISVMDYGDTGLVELCIIRPIKDNAETIDVTHIKPSDTDDQIFSTVHARYFGLFAE